jgi:hypothetical protein
MAFDVLVNGNVNDTCIASFVTASGTNLKILVDASPARMLAAISGETPAVSRPLQGGVRITDATASSTNASANTLLVYDGMQILTATAISGAGSVTVTNATTITFGTSGAPYTAGIRVGDVLTVFSASAGAVPEANEGLLIPVTAVTATTITTSATLSGTAALAIGSRLVKVALDYATSVPANAGNSATIANVALLANGNDSSADKIGIDMGANSVLLAGMSAAISGTGAVVARAKARGY